MSINKTLYSRLGGKAIFEKVHKIFYDKAYKHVWLKKFFIDKPQEILESQQTDFMIQLMGGPKQYAGKTPKSAHHHMVITEELFELRAKLLSDSIEEVGVADELRVEWLAADAALKRSLIKSSAEECTTAYQTQVILNFKR